MLDTGLAKIQLVYTNDFPSIWEYHRAIRAERIDFFAYIGPVCPICADECGYREITPYSRGVIELFPIYRTGDVDIARFQCKATYRTFSLLPHHLVPYHRYTVDSMVIALIVACRLLHELGSPGLEKVLARLPADCEVTTWLLRCWVETIGVGFRRAHFLLAVRYDLSGICSGISFSDRLREISCYFAALGIRGPPDDVGITPLLLCCRFEPGRFLVGIPSQERRHRSAR